MCLQSLVSFCKFVLKLLSKNQILISIKGRNSVANLRKTMIYYTKVDLVDDNVYTKFGLNRSIRFQDIEQRLNSDVKEVECSQDFSHYKSNGIFPDAKGQLTPHSLVRSGRNLNSSEMLWTDDGSTGIL